MESPVRLVNSKPGAGVSNEGTGWGADPWVRLAAAMAIQAVKDLKSRDLIRALDALAWFIDGEAENILTELDIFPGDAFQKAVNYES